MHEQRACHAAVDLSHRPVIRVGGPDRLSWLHSLTTQHLTSLPPGVLTEALILSPHGHVDIRCCSSMTVSRRGCRTRHRRRAGGLSRLDALPAPCRGGGPQRRVGGPRRSTPRQRPPGCGGGRAVRPATTRSTTSYGRRMPLAGMWASEALRIEAGRPRLGFETDHRTIPHEVGWLSRQYTWTRAAIAGRRPWRVHNLGRPPRRLVFLHLDGSAETLPRTAPLSSSMDGRSASSPRPRPRAGPIAWPSSSATSRSTRPTGRRGSRGPGRRRRRMRSGGRPDPPRADCRTRRSRRRPPRGRRRSPAARRAARAATWITP